MNGSRNTRTLRWVVALAGALLPALLPSGPAAETSRPEDRLRDVKRKIRSEEKLVEEIRISRSGVLATLEAMDARIEKTRGELRASRARSRELAGEIEQLREELKGLEHQVAARRQEAGRRLDALYRLGRDGVLPVVFSAASFPRKMRDLEALRRILNEDWTEIRSFYGLLEEKEGVEQAVQARLAEERALEETTRSQERELVAKRTEKEALRVRLEKDEKLHGRLLQELYEAARELEAMMRRAAEAPVRAAVPMDGSLGVSFASRKGHLPWPVKGEIFRRFGFYDEASVKAKVRSQGIEIRTLPDEPVRAVWGGSVVHADWLRGYGNLVVVDHGQKHYTVLSRLSRMTKSRGDPVEAGEVVGYAGDAGPPEGSVVHFAVWRDGTPENPLHWVRKEGR